MSTNVKYARPLVRLIEELQKLPGVGPKSAERMAFSLLSKNLSEVEELSVAVLEAKKQIKNCSVCHNLSTDDYCDVCLNKSRDRRVICVVSEVKDLAAIERTNQFHGVYHVLGGLISPIDGIGPDDLSIKDLLERAGKNNLEEIIIALDTSTEGEATTLYLHRILSPIISKITRLAFGLPFGTELEYADELTLLRALENRTRL